MFPFLLLSNSRLGSSQRVSGCRNGAYADASFTFLGLFLSVLFRIFGKVTSLF